MGARIMQVSSLLLVSSILILYLPTLYNLFDGVWSSDEQMHGPLVLAISIFLIYRKWDEMQALAVDQPPSNLGWVWISVAIFLYIVGRTQQIILFELGSLIPFLAGIGLLNFGRKALRAQWFPLFFMLFMIPLPNAIVDLLTMPMKIFVSYCVEHILYWFDYPIARTGVILQLGQYKLLVANACAGLHTLLTLEAMGLLYLSLVQRDSFFRNTTMVLLIIPISLTANVIRVLVLSLVTFHFGDEAGQGYLHNFAGMVLFISALLLIISFDNLVQYIENKRRK